MTPEQLLENFKTQQAQVAEEIRKLDTELAQKKELYIKLQGAIEGLDLLNPKEEAAESADTEVITEALA
jgi:hypothetical protein